MCSNIRSTEGGEDCDGSSSVASSSDKEKKSSDDNGVRSQIKVIRRMSSQLSQELKPETPQGWVIFLSFMSSVALGYEAKLQKKLTCPPSTYGQITSNPTLHTIFEHLTSTPQSILNRKIKPSMFVGTNGLLASGGAYWLPHFASSEGFLQVEEIYKMPQDGAEVKLVWELPPGPESEEEKKNTVLRGPINQLVVIILPGIFNHTGFGYMRAIMRACTKRGWIAVGVNYRALAGVPLKTPRAFTPAYTGDLRSVVRSVGGRLAEGQKLFLVGHSMGGNLITKYLGEEGMNETLPKFVGGGVSLGNPLDVDPARLPMFGKLMHAAVIKEIISNYRSLRRMTAPSFQEAIRKALFTMDELKCLQALLPQLPSNSPYEPYETRLGYKGGVEEFFEDSSSCRFVRHVSVPLLMLSSKDDFICLDMSSKHVALALSNPHVMVVQTKCGGHLGWRESPPDTGNIFGFGTSWADTATTEFIEAVLKGEASERFRGNSVENLENSVKGRAMDFAATRLRSRM